MTGSTTREAGQKCGLTQHSLRWYERIGLLDRISRGADGRRQFSDSGLDWLMLLCQHRDCVRQVLLQQECLELLDAKIKIKITAGTSSAAT